ncbi:dihydrolipoamide acetyltransferase family protein [Georgenia sp. SYP-B2076]|uniref:dihydrolipoamide acetyltransferase family protein n=1 Tax=Georgenia sp. SYP-B2076 TaxID=2495881 RepID=UPI00197A7152|nr:dihydrolipoamide acetyltransferase family protein [Georgenia sp. SYP-B2076]
MATEIRMPMWGMGMLEGTIVEWYKQEGDAVEEGEALAEIEAAKTVEDLVAPFAGVLQRIVVPQGATVPVQEVLAILAADGEGADSSAAEAPEGSAEPGPVPTAAGGLVPAAAAVGGAAEAPTGGTVRNVVPRARQRAKQLDVDLAIVTGTGPGGRIGVEDVERAAASSAATADATTPAPAPAPAPGDGTTIALTGMRGTIARRMRSSLQSTAQLTLVTTADVTDLVEYRETLEARPTYTDFVVKAAALALREHPGLNATIDGDRIHLLPDIHVGVATAVPDGLVVPVIRHADAAPLARIAEESAALVAKVRAGTFGAEDVTGSTFTVTSLGGQGIDAFTPIINPPEVAILGVGRIVDQPARDGDGLLWRKVVTLSLTIDHQAVDGAPGAAFLETLDEFLASPEMLAE